MEAGLKELGKETEGWEIQEGKVSELEGGLGEKLSQQDEQAVVDVFPEGGCRAYGAVAGAVLVLLSTFG